MTADYRACEIDGDEGAASTAMQWDAVLLHPRDNVATALRALDAGERVRVRTPDGVIHLEVLEAIPLCHKFARHGLDAQDEVLKYGEVIGAASQVIAAGAWVHVHNIRSLRGRSSVDATST